MSFSKPKIPATATPAERPERQTDVQPEDIVTGDSDSNDSTTRRGKRSLLRPASATTTGVSTGTQGAGLAV